MRQAMYMGTKKFIFFSNFIPMGVSTTMENTDAFRQIANIPKLCQLLSSTLADPEIKTQ